jgi:signal transduction histidine kinase
MSHELRTPLNVIFGFAQLLEMRDLGPDVAEPAEHILKAGHHLLGLINEVLDIARIEAGRVVFALEPVSVRAVLEETLELITPLADERDCAVEYRPADASDPRVMTDPQRVKQVLLNLLSNALKYNREHGTVRVAFEERPDARVRIVVADTGLGIPADKMRDLFTPFARLGAERTDVQGSGLGLALSKRLIEAMGGEIGVESVVNEGSTFWIALPQAGDPAVTVRPHPVAPPAPVSRRG